MAFPGLSRTWSRWKASVSNALAADCPPEMAACQVCQQHNCANEEWLKCPRRLAAKRYLEAGDRAAIERLQQAQAGVDQVCVKIPAK